MEQQTCHEPILEQSGMRIGIMLRTLPEKQGIGIYTRNLLEQFLDQDKENEFVLFYRDAEFLGTHASNPRVTEVLVTAPNKLLWDQVFIPLAAKRHNIDVLFHTKFTVPFLSPCKTVMTIHGSSWFVHPELYKKLDIAYINMVMPFYCKKATAILSNSHLTTGDFVKLLRVPESKITTIHLGTDNSYKVIDDNSILNHVRETYKLPEKFILSVIKYDPRKNFKNLIAAFRLLRKEQPCKLVVAGIGCEQYIEEYDLHADGTADDVTFLGWIEQETLPALYSLARCHFFPSVYEEFGIPSCEAMACGCPPVVSNTGALPEVAGDAGLIVDPFNPEEMKNALARIWNDDVLHAELRKRSRARSSQFTWEHCAKESLKIICAAGISE